ncbi:MAG: peptidoglycan DD-metalloendopeptidase family protein [Deltaproteobacteria bacterium]|nr:peptidoglycan DD-metalloendopeptidase family protein [Nannocystaceae bacterium]
MSRSRQSPTARANSAKAVRNRKVEVSGRAKSRKVVDPAERRTRNRTFLALGLLAAINGWVFFGRGGSLGELAGIGAAAIEDRSGPLPPLADPPAHPCGGDPVRIFEGLEQLLPLSSTLSGGMTLRLALLQLGIVGEEIDRIEASVRTHVDLSLLGGSGAPLRLAIDRHGTVHALEIELAEGHILQACRDGEGSEPFEVRNIQHPLRTDVEVVDLELGGDADLAAAVVEAGEKPELAELIAAALAWDVDFMTEARPGDRVQVMVEKRWLGRRFHRYGQSLAVRFVGASARVAYFRYKPEGGAAAFYDPEGAPMRRTLLRSPVGFHRVAPDARGLLPPSIEVVQGRIGAVYRLPEGAPLVALGDGEVTDLDRSASEGHVVELRFDDGTIARYAHVMRVVGELSVGSKVRQGEIVALAGHSGRTPSDRLRLELRRDDVEDDKGVRGTKVIDPLLLLGRDTTRPELVGAPIPAAQRKRFTDDVAPWARALKLAR